MLYAATGIANKPVPVAETNGNGTRSASEENKEKKEGGGGLYDLKTRKQIQAFLEVGARTTS